MRASRNGDTAVRGPFQRIQTFLESLEVPSIGGYRSVPGGPATLYATAYGHLSMHYLGRGPSHSDGTWDFVLGCQDPETGYFVGPELSDWSPEADSKHDREHLLLHLACATLPLLQQYDVRPRHPLRFAHRFCDRDHLAAWLQDRDLSDAWFEGNNLLFVGQLLVYLRDVEGHPEAAAALEQWFAWLDHRIDPATGLWGTDGQCSAFVAMCGGYHQLLVYYHQDRPIRSIRSLIDTVLALQHQDGGFSPNGGGGACEDVDAVDILVNLYKRVDHRRPEIRVALRRCLHSILDLQNPDGGFPYKRWMEQDHMGIPATRAGINVSTMFSTWFRLHTSALIAEILTDEPALEGFEPRFSRALSMGWHEPWDRRARALGIRERIQEIGPRWRSRDRSLVAAIRGRAGAMRRRARQALGAGIGRERSGGRKHDVA